MEAPLNVLCLYAQRGSILAHGRLTAQAENFFKKGIDKEGEVCYLMQAVREGGGKIPSPALEVGKARKDFQRKSKKGLDKRFKMWYLR